MAYDVSIAARAERDFTGLYAEIDAENTAAAQKWYRGLRKAVLSLEKLPNRCPVTREDPQLRHLLYGRKPHVYRVIYRELEREERVEVSHIRHGAMREFVPSARA
ncbi:MAG: type II toxin-antitoxin system RelE/ParE family toxin [Terracidiphilus sp.]